MPHRKFDFNEDTFAFANDLVWEYHVDPVTNKMIFGERIVKPDYTHRCFVLSRSARQFLYHAHFDANRATANDDDYRKLIRKIVSRNPRVPSPPGERVCIPGFKNLREFSAARESLLKEKCGAAWESYALRSHWRMVFPISRAHQAKTADRLVEALRKGVPPIVHVVLFPALTINHGMMVFDVCEVENGIDFAVYDPNVPTKPTQLSYHPQERTFYFPANHYWAGGKLNVIDIYRNWFF